MYVIVSVLLYSLTYARNCRTVTKKCPIGELKWKSRAQQFDCLNENGKYTCLRDNENNLVETCVETVLINKGVVGCPYVLLCKNNFALIGLDEDFHDCPTNRTGCPPKNHRGYALHEIYKYPACSTFDSTSATEENTKIQNKDSTTSEIPWIPFVILLISIVTLMTVLGILFYKRRNKDIPPCCGRTHSSKEFELGTKKPLFRDDEPKANGPDDKELRDEAIQTEIRQFGDEMNDAIGSQVSGKIMEKINEWQKETVHIGIAGPSMASKSSFIDAMLGTSRSEKAEIKLGNTSLIPTVYHHPKNKGLQLWDFSRYGTRIFNLNERSLQEMKVQHCDFLLIFYQVTISNMDIEFARHLLRMKRKFAFVKNRADDFNRLGMKGKPFDYWVSLAKNQCRDFLNKEGITEEVPIFVISNISHSLGEFDNLINFLTENTPEIKRINMFVTFKRQTSEMINYKQFQLLDRAWKAALAIGISTTLPIPGIELAFDMALLEKEIMFYLEVFQLDEESLKEHPQKSVKQLRTCHEILKVGRVKFIIDSISKFEMLSTIGNVFEFALPILGGIKNGPASTYCVYNFLKRVIAKLAEDARTLNKLQTDSLL